MNKLTFNKDNIPDELKKLTADGEWTENLTGCSSSRVFKLSYGSSCSYLKSSSSLYVGEYRWEKEILAWLKGRLPVPEVLYYEETGDTVYLLISEIKGTDGADPVFHKDIPGFIKIFAKGLKLIHSVDISDCSLYRNLDIKLKLVAENITKGIVAIDNFNEENIERTPEDIYEQLLQERPVQEDLVFTHGDYCVPNILIDNSKLSGFIDFGRAGIADRYQDLALAVRTIRYNFQEQKYVDLFFKYYGLDNVDKYKIDYYILLDELN
jgi:aminoglycoside phosphotransferase